MAYATFDTIVFDSGLSYSHIMNLGVAEFTIPDNAVRGKGRDGGYWGWNEKVNGGKVNLQAYIGEPGDTVILHAELREKKLAPEKGSYKFLFLKLTATDAEVDTQVVVGNGAYLRRVEDEADADAEVTTVWCPQQKHDGGVAAAPLGVQLPAKRPTSHKVSRKAS